MPILAAEPNLFPDTLFEALPAETLDRSWCAIYTTARQEKALARDLLRFEVPFYLPLVPKDNYIRAKLMRSHIPLFAGYVFMFGGKEEYSRVLSSHRVSRILAVNDGEELWHDLRQVAVLIASGASLTVERRLMPGQRVRVKSGPMIGFEGTVTSRRGDSRLLIHVNFLHQGASVAIDNCMLEPIDKARAR